MAPSPRRDDAPLARMALAAAVATMAGVLLAALAFPVVGGVGLVAKAGADNFLSLPSDLGDATLAQRSRILAADGSLLATLYLENRVSVALTDVPVLARKALIAIEDARFYAHNGVDVKGTLRAALRNGASGSVQQGGSTLTQQYVKNVLLASAANRAGQDAARSRSLDRKLREARYALTLEHRYTKDQILERYLNIAYYGNGVYGIGTAANYYFGEPVQSLTLAQGATLAGMVQNPRRFDPDPARGPKVRAALVARRNTVLARMAALGFITSAEQAQAAAEPIRTRIRKVGSGCEATGVRAAFFCDYIRRALEDDTPLGNALGTNRTQRQQRLLGGGLTIHTTLDPRIQLAAQTAVDAQAPAQDPTQQPPPVAAVADVVEPGTGAVKAMAVDRTFGEGKSQTKVNLALGGTSGFQAGSTFKVFVLTAALEMGIPTSLTLDAPQRYYSHVFTDCSSGTCRPYAPSNAGDSESGTFDLVRATHESVNTYYVQLEERTGVSRPAAVAESLGVHQFDAAEGRPHLPLLRGGAFTLGANEVSPLDMAAAYASFAAHGSFCAPRPVTAIEDATGAPVAVPAAQCVQAVDPSVADTVTSILQGVIDGPWPNRTGRAASIGRPAAGKTGTTDGSRAAWFVGFTPQLAAAVWVGKVTPTPLQNVTINGQFYKQVFGGSLPAPMWSQLMGAAVAPLPVADFTTADSGGSTSGPAPVPAPPGPAPAPAPAGPTAAVTVPAKPVPTAPASPAPRRTAPPPPTQPPPPTAPPSPAPNPSPTPTPQ